MNTLKRVQYIASCHVASMNQTRAFYAWTALFFHILRNLASFFYASVFHDSSAVTLDNLLTSPDPTPYLTCNDSFSTHVSGN